MSRCSASASFSLLLWFLLVLVLIVSPTPVASFNCDRKPSTICCSADHAFSTTLNNNIRPSSRSFLQLSRINDDDPEDPLPLDKFRSLMGNLYGVAGLAHAADCYLGQSQLLVAAGSPPVSELNNPVGQALVAIWCAAGPAAFVASRIGGTIADFGLIVYGAVEVAGAAVLVNDLSTLEGSAMPEIDALMNAIIVQGIVFGSWIYSRNKSS